MSFGVPHSGHLWRFNEPVATSCGEGKVGAECLRGTPAPPGAQLLLLPQQPMVEGRALSVCLYLLLTPCSLTLPHKLGSGRNLDFEQMYKGLKGIGIDLSNGSA